MTNQIYHLIGIGGIGMSGLARIALQRGSRVSGSDVKASAVTQALEQEGISVFIGHSVENVPENSKIVYSTDISLDNPEMQEAKKKGLPLLHRSAFLEELMEGFSSLLVTGTHGKTTTSSLLAHVLISLKEDPSYSIGGIVQSLQSNGGFGRGKWFVAEADESDRSFLAYTPYGAILTNIGIDHLNHWHSEENLLQGFFDFYQKVQNKNFLFWCRDDDRLTSLNLQGVSYGFSPDADLKIENVFYLGWKSVFTLKWKDKIYTDIEIPMIGVHNVLNATAVFGLCLRMGFDEIAIRTGFQTFLGVRRRVEKKGEAQSITVYDDYGHHPTEISATLQAVKIASQGRRIVVAFQPHRFTRTRDCFQEFAPALEKADLVLLTDVYSAGESPIDGIDSQNLFCTFSNKASAYYSTRKDLIDTLLELLHPGDIVVSMGAGDITQIGSELLKRLNS